MSTAVAGSPRRHHQPREVEVALHHSQRLLLGRRAANSAVRAGAVLALLLIETLFTPVSRLVGLPVHYTWFAGCLLSCVLSCRVAINLYLFLSSRFFGASVSLTLAQRRLLGIPALDTSVQTVQASKADESKQFTYSPWPWFTRRPNNSMQSWSQSVGAASSPNTSVLNSSLDSVGFSPHSLSYNSSGAFSTSANSFSWQQQQSMTDSRRGSRQLSSTPLMPAATLRRRVLDSSNTVALEDSVRDEESLKEFLKEHSFDLGDGGSGTLGRGALFTEGPELRPAEAGYQLSTRAPHTPAASAADSGAADPSAAENVWELLGVPDWRLDRWTENLRHWLCITVLRPLVVEFDSLNEQLRRLGYEAMLIGDASVTNMKQLGMTKSSQLPSLNALLPFLDTSAPQDYLVNRIKELSRGRCVSDFNWSGGGVHKGKSWEDHLPTDSALVMHLLCRYLDNRLPALPYPLGSAPFSDFHFLCTPQKPDLTKSDQIVIYQSNINPPCFQVIVGDEIWKPAGGRNNMFQAILLFLHMVKTKESKLLGPVKLGKAGINILWVLDI